MTSRGVVIFLAVFLSGLAGQEKSPRTVWDGIYSEDQAVRGAADYREACARCHGARLEGRGQTPPLAGGDFTEDWDGMSVGDLFDKVQLSMPADRPGQLSANQYVRILAFLLKFNDFPAGNWELPASADALRGILFEAEKTGK